MNLNAAGSLEDLTALEDGAGTTGTGEASCGAGSGGLGMSAQALKRLENLKIDKLKQIRRPTPPGRGMGNSKLPTLNGKRGSDVFMYVFILDCACLLRLVFLSQTVEAFIVLCCQS